MMINSDCRSMIAEQNQATIIPCIGFMGVLLLAGIANDGSSLLSGSSNWLPLPSSRVKVHAIGSTV